MSVPTTTATLAIMKQQQNGKTASNKEFRKQATTLCVCWRIPSASEKDFCVRVHTSSLLKSTTIKKANYSNCIRNKSRHFVVYFFPLSSHYFVYCYCCSRIGTQQKFVICFIWFAMRPLRFMMPHQKVRAAVDKTWRHGRHTEAKCLLTHTYTHTLIQWKITFPNATKSCYLKRTPTYAKLVKSNTLLPTRCFWLI